MKTTTWCGSHWKTPVICWPSRCQTAVLNESTVYKFRARFRGNTLPESEWSQVHSATTSDVFYKPGSVVNGDVVVGQLDGYWLLAANASFRKEGLFATTGSWGQYEKQIDNSFADPVSGYDRTEHRVQNYSASDYPAFNFCHQNGYFLPNRKEVSFMFQKPEFLFTW